MAIFSSRRAVTGLVALTCVLAASQTAWAQGRPGEHGAPAPRGGAATAPAPMGGGGAPRGGYGGGYGGGGFGGGAPVAQPAPAEPSMPAAPSAGRGWSGGDRGDWNRGDRGGWNRGNGSGAPATTPAPQPNWGATQPGRHGTDGYRQPENRPPVMGGGYAPRNDGRNDGWRNDGWRGEGRRDNGWAGGRNDSWRGNSWNHNWRGDNRYDWRSLRNDNRMAFHVGRYYPPYRGYTYRRMSVGLVLDRLFYGPTYYITDYYNYRLPAPYGPYQWVRYWDDAVLVDTYTGEVVDVLYDFFW